MNPLDIGVTAVLILAITGAIFAHFVTQKDKLHQN